MSAHFTAQVTPPPFQNDSDRWFVFRGFDLLTTVSDGRAEVPTYAMIRDLGLRPDLEIYLGRLSDGTDSIPCYSGEVARAIGPPDGMAFMNLRSLYPMMDEDCFWLAGRAVQIIDWDRTHRYCGRCGHETRSQTHERAKICPNCGLTSYPRLAPAMIVRVDRVSAEGEPQILLARASRFPAGLFSVLAGFVEPGETLEECVQREVREEVGISVTNIRYFGSQPWPFPHSLMIAFTAQHEAGEIEVDPDELVEANWYSAGDLPNTPPPPSVAHRLIHAWLAERGRPPAS